MLTLIYSSLSSALSAKVENSSITSLNLNSRSDTVLEGVFHDALALLHGNNYHTLSGALSRVSQLSSGSVWFVPGACMRI